MSKKRLSGQPTQTPSTSAIRAAQPEQTGTEAMSGPKSETTTAGERSVSPAANQPAEAPVEALKDADVRIGEENDVGLREVEVTIAGQTVAVEADCEDEASLAELALSIAQDLNLPPEVFEQLPEIVKRRLGGELRPPDTGEAFSLVTGFIERARSNPENAVKAALKDTRLLQSLAILSTLSQAASLRLRLVNLRAAA